MTLKHSEMDTLLNNLVDFTDLWGEISTKYDPI